MSVAVILLVAAFAFAVLGGAPLPFMWLVSMSATVADRIHLLALVSLATGCLCGMAAALIVLWYAAGWVS